MILLIATMLFCTPAPKQVKIIHKPSPEATFKQRWLALHFRELAQ